MNKFTKAVKELNLALVKELLQKEPEWVNWSEEDGKNALHYLCAVVISKTPKKTDVSLEMLKLLLKKGMNINSVHKIPDGNCPFPATPLWYAYTRGRNEKLFSYILKAGADPEHCMFAIAWYDDVKAAELFKKYGAQIDDESIGNTPFLSAFNWNKFKIAEWFLKNGADVNTADPEGNTALHYAVKKNLKAEHIELLLKYNADFNKKNKEGLSPKGIAERNRKSNLLKLFNTTKTL